MLILLKKNRISSLLAFLLIGCLFTDCESATSEDNGLIFIKNISTIDPIHGLKENQSVLIKDGKIVEVGLATKLTLPKGGLKINGRGKFLIPGLWDAHVHFAYIEEIAAIMPNLFLAYGITSVRDTGGKIKLVKHFQNKSLVNPTNFPRIMIAGPLLDGTPNVYDGSDNARPPLSVGHNSLDDLSNSIKMLDSIGVDLLKAYEMLSEEQFKLLSKMAKNKNLPLTGHVPLSMDVISASNAGLGGIEHLRNIELSCSSNSSELLAERKQLLKNMDGLLGGTLRSSIHRKQRINAISNYDSAKAEEVIEVLHRNKTYQIPTISLISGLYQRHWSDSLWMSTFKYLPDSVANAWVDWSTEWTKNPPRESFKSHRDWSMMMIQKMYAKGVPFMAGTDTPILFATPGFSLHKELALLVEAGFSPLDALKTATINPAQYFNIDKDLGRIQQGMIADLVILNANPLKDINNTTQIEAVIKNGKHMAREDLNLILSGLASLN